jgi:uncharacterized protein
LDRRELALVIMSELAGSPGERYLLDRIRVQKAVFLLVKRGSPSWRNLYSYKPYDWGPYSSQLAADMDMLVSEDSLEVEAAPGSRYGRYRTTAVGEAQAFRSWERLDPSETAFIRSVRAYVTQKSFTQLLREVYAEYPSYATASRFTG